MNSAEEICIFCGGEIIFRHINGIIVPIHTGESTCIGKKLYRSDQEGIPHPTTCPRCQANVIFLRHNGGCVWLESLGWPWPKHPCFDSEHSSDKSKHTLPEAAWALPGGQLKFTKVEGPLKSRQGFVIRTCSDRQNLRKWNDSWFIFYKVFCPEENIDDHSQSFHAATVVISRSEMRLVALNGMEFKIEKHERRYPKWVPPK